MRTFRPCRSTVLALSGERFSALGMAFKRRPLRAAALAHRDLGAKWAELDAEAHGLPVAEVVRAVNAAAPRWAGFNLLAPTYGISADIAAALDPGRGPRPSAPPRTRAPNPPT
jgi:hypothetical protein